jgi:hypothetical protein
MAHAFVADHLAEISHRVREYLSGSASHAEMQRYVSDVFNAWEALPSDARSGSAEREEILWHCLWTLQHVAGTEHWAESVTQRELRECLALLESDEPLPEGYVGRRP